jgi:hypothetical protein
MRFSDSAPRIAPPKALRAASIRAWETLQLSPIACSQASVPSKPTGAEPITLRPAARKARTEAV